METSEETKQILALADLLLETDGLTINESMCAIDMAEDMYARGIRVLPEIANTEH